MRGSQGLRAGPRRERWPDPAPGAPPPARAPPTPLATSGPRTPRPRTQTCAPGPIHPTRRGRIVCKRFTNSVFPTPVAPSRRHIPLPAPLYTRGSASRRRQALPPGCSLVLSAYRLSGRGPICAQRLGRAERPASPRLASRPATCACAHSRRQAEAEVGGAPARSGESCGVRSGSWVAMGRGSGTFERLLGNAAPAPGAKAPGPQRSGATAVPPGPWAGAQATQGRRSGARPRRRPSK